MVCARHSFVNKSWHECSGHKPLDPRCPTGSRCQTKNPWGNWVGCQRLAGLAVAAVVAAVVLAAVVLAAAAVALGCQRLAGLAVELAVELATLALRTRTLVVGVGVMVKKKRHRFFSQSLDSVDANAKVRCNHFHCLILGHGLESTAANGAAARPTVLQLGHGLSDSRPTVLQLCQHCQRLDARLRLLNTYTPTTTSTSPTSPPPLRLCPWLDQLCGCLSRQQLRQRRLSRQLEHLFCCLSR